MFSSPSVGPSPCGLLEGRLIVCPFFPDQINTPWEMKRAYEKVVTDANCSGVGSEGRLAGGFSSILEAQTVMRWQSGLG